MGLFSNFSVKREGPVLRLFVFFVLLVFAGNKAALAAEDFKVVASTAWTAAFCAAAGLEEVAILAPMTLQHPPDYELRPSDIPLLAEADLLVFGGYEGMVKRLKVLVGKETILLPIQTSYNPVELEKSVRSIAQQAGTEKIAEKNLLEIRGIYAKARETLTAEGFHASALVSHRFQTPLARALGLDVLLEFGPAPPGPKLIQEASGKDALIVIDNWHNPVATPLIAVMDKPLSLQWFTFPGQQGTRRLEDVIRANVQSLTGILMGMGEDLPDDKENH